MRKKTPSHILPLPSEVGTGVGLGLGPNGPLFGT